MVSEGKGSKVMQGKLIITAHFIQVHLRCFTNKSNKYFNKKSEKKEKKNRTTIKTSKLSWNTENKT